jgi:hypothetical protein
VFLLWISSLSYEHFLKWKDEGGSYIDEKTTKANALRFPQKTGIDIGKDYVLLCHVCIYSLHDLKKPWTLRIYWSHFRFCGSKCIARCIHDKREHELSGVTGLISGFVGVNTYMTQKNIIFPDINSGFLGYSGKVMFPCVVYVSRYVITPTKPEVRSGTPERSSFLVSCMYLLLQQNQ